MTESVTATNSYLYPLDASEEVRKENTFGGDGVCAESQTDAVFNCKKVSKSNILSPTQTKRIFFFLLEHEPYGIHFMFVSS